MTYLVDANILTEATKRTPSPRVVRWLRHNERRLTDSLIAVTALAHGFVLATRNRRDFEASGVEIVDPFG